MKIHETLILIFFLCFISCDSNPDVDLERGIKNTNLKNDGTSASEKESSQRIYSLLKEGNCFYKDSIPYGFICYESPIPEGAEHYVAFLPVLLDTTRKGLEQFSFGSMRIAGQLERFECMLLAHEAELASFSDSFDLVGHLPLRIDKPSVNSYISVYYFGTNHMKELSWFEGILNRDSTEKIIYLNQIIE